jgi:hypothetical protein
VDTKKAQAEYMRRRLELYKIALRLGLRDIKTEGGLLLIQLP